MSIQPVTPLPWQYRDDYTTEGFVTVIGNIDGEYVEGTPHCTYDVVCRCEDEFGERLPNVGHNVRYIVHACNTFPELVEALEDTLRRIENSNYWWMDSPDRGGMDAEKICAAIAKARGQA